MQNILKTLGCITLLTFSSLTVADNNLWLGVFGQYYEVDDDKQGPIETIDDGLGLGFELGVQFHPKWGARIEFTRQNLHGVSDEFDQNADHLGVDALYFLNPDMAYLFAGFRNQQLDLAGSFQQLSAGVGKQWRINDDWRFITEAAAFRDLDEDFNDYGFKIGVARFFGQPQRAPAARLDTDGDGVYDDTDACPNTPTGTRVDARGCALPQDSDGDGVMDSSDRCPNTPRGTPVDAFGCPQKTEQDSDGDGVFDSQDACPGTPKEDQVDAKGCSIFTEKEVSISLNVLFDNDSDVVRNPDSGDIRDFVDFLKRFPNTQATIEGHTSAVGDAAYNQGLSERRAAATKNLLVERYGIAGGRLNTVGYGETRLLDSADTAAAHRINRRIEAKVTAMQKQKLNR